MIKLWKLPGKPHKTPDGKPRPARYFIRTKYPHMGPWEAAIWNDFLLWTNLQFIVVYYDTRVGPGYDPGPAYPPEVRRMALELTKLRIDACAQSPDACWIFEVKPRAGRSALGQLLSYAHYIMKDYPPPSGLPLRLGVVCRYVDVNMREVFMSRGIVVFEVPKVVSASERLVPPGYSSTAGLSTSREAVKKYKSALEEILKK